ncbi:MULTISPECIES: DUF2190 family protein [Phytobacter]|uniref:RecA/RadA family phage recombinase n=1 Tax=Phytobacter diazotrophicus TaxID=395631 RepID=A0ABM7VX46_9ENTR|nr:MULTISPECIES: capsid cement protein [Phytobacter]AUU88807.1 DUF2190 domain-containing protein [Enterobacteriaceae bacterium ENNIH3]AUV05902.1 DUF2190 domain-containing protein [Enterobacteriaceae bacterium ENNIH2]SLK13116.1 Predicted phage recombinase, RecA/RadA family [Enterobacter sp. NFR05]BBE76909.1 hypothetical protein MRY16398_19650 [Phytobacter sp. MRY16-398]BBE78452.1 hypothetical protein MRY16398_35080 [Phytobacter sp. MRY16-398]
MKNYVQDGNTLALTNAGSSVITSGTPVAVGDLLVIALTDIQPGSTGDGLATGVVALPKLSTDDIAQGKTVYFKDGKIQLASTSATPAGKAWEAAGASSTSVLVRLNG